MNIMKKVTKLLVTVFALAVIFCSCQKEPQLIGRWKLTNLTFENQMISSMMMGYTQQAVGEVFEFKADGTMISESAEINAGVEVDGNVHYSLDGNNITITVDSDIVTDTTMTQEEIEIIQQYKHFDINGTYELPDKSKLKMKLGFPMPDNPMHLTEIKFAIEADRQ